MTIIERHEEIENKVLAGLHDIHGVLDLFLSILRRFYHDHAVPKNKIDLILSTLRRTAEEPIKSKKSFICQAAEYCSVQSGQDGNSEMQTEARGILNGEGAKVENLNKCKRDCSVQSEENGDNKPHKEEGDAETHNEDEKDDETMKARINKNGDMDKEKGTSAICLSTATSISLKTSLTEISPSNKTSHLTETSSTETASTETSSTETSSTETSSTETSSTETSSTETSSIDTSSIETSSIDTSSIDTSSIETSSTNTSSTNTSSTDTSSTDPSSTESSPWLKARDSSAKSQTSSKDVKLDQKHDLVSVTTTRAHQRKTVSGLRPANITLRSRPQPVSIESKGDQDDLKITDSKVRKSEQLRRISNITRSKSNAIDPKSVAADSESALGEPEPALIKPETRYDLPQSEPVGSRPNTESRGEVNSVKGDLQKDDQRNSGTVIDIASDGPTSQDIEISDRILPSTQNIPFPTSFGGDAVETIRMLISWAKIEHEYQRLKLPRDLDFDKDVAPFDPSRKVPTETWQSSAVVLELLRLISAELEGVQVIDPLFTTNAIQNHKHSLLRLDQSCHTFIAPLFVNGNHWCLILLRLKRIDGGPTTAEIRTSAKRRLEGGSAIALLKEAIAEWAPETEWTIYTLNDESPDARSCGNYVVAQAETALFPEREIDWSPAELRLRHLQMILNPHSSLQRFQEFHSPPLKRKRGRYDGSPSKKQRVSYCTLASQESEKDRKSPGDYGDSWASIDRVISDSGLSWKILPLVRAFGGPEVISDLAGLLHLSRTEPMPELLTNSVHAAVTLYDKSNLTIVRSILAKRYAAFFLRSRFNDLLVSCQADLHNLRKQKQREFKIAKNSTNGGLSRESSTSRPGPKAPGSGLGAKSRVLNQLAADFLECTVTEALKNNDLKEIKKHLMEIINEGEQLWKFHQGAGLNLDLIVLLPTRQLPGELSKTNAVEPEWYFQLDEKELSTFKTALNELRPKLHRYPLQKLRQIVTGHLDLSVTYKLETMSSYQICQHQLDADELIQCMDVSESAQLPSFPTQPATQEEIDTALHALDKYKANQFGYHLNSNLKALHAASTPAVAGEHYLIAETTEQLRRFLLSAEPMPIVVRAGSPLAQEWDQRFRRWDFERLRNLPNHPNAKISVQRMASTKKGWTEEMKFSAAVEKLASDKEEDLNILDVGPLAPDQRRIPEICNIDAIENSRHYRDSSKGRHLQNPHWKELLFMLLSSRGVYSVPHQDGSGFWTWIYIEVGVKRWYWIPGSLEQQLKLFSVFGKELTEGFVYYDLGAGDALFQNPGIVHAVLTLLDCICSGGFFLTVPTLHLSLRVAEFHDAQRRDDLTNDLPVPQTFEMWENIVAWLRGCNLAAVGGDITSIENFHGALSDFTALDTQNDKDKEQYWKDKRIFINTKKDPLCRALKLFLMKMKGLASVKPRMIAENDENCKNGGEGQIIVTRGSNRRSGRGLRNEMA